MTGYACNWHPLTWLSHMLDCGFYGLNPGGHHVTNLIFHLANTLLLFGIVRLMTGAPWRSALAAALFAWHPLHVESVAWVAERKDVLSAFFGFATLWAWWFYLKAPTWGRYGAVMACFALGLMAKPMLVTLPLVLLLLDFWPLRRLPFPTSISSLSSMIPLLREKLPLFALSTLSSWVTLWAQKTGGAMDEIHPPLGERIANALVSYVRYLAKIFWPRDLALPYPYLHNLPWSQIAGAGVFLLLISWLAWRCALDRPHFAVGWFWFLIMLVPVIGLVQVGKQSMADRYTYLPAIGIFLIAAWGIPGQFASRPGAKWVLGGVAVLVLGGCVMATAAQLRYWRDSLALFGHAVEVNGDNAVAQYNLAEAYAARGDGVAAMTHYGEVLRIDPDNFEARNSLGLLLEQQGRLDDAIAQYTAALKIRPESEAALNNLGLALVGKGRVDEGIAQFRAALKSKNNRDSSLVNLGLALTRKGSFDEAIAQFREAIKCAPDNSYAHSSLADALLAEGKSAEAIPYYREAVRLNPQHTAPLERLAWILATHSNAKYRDGAEAVRLATLATQQGGPNNLAAWDAMAAAFAETGQFTEAVNAAGRAIAIANAAQRPDLAARIQKRSELYQAGRPFHETP
jgi:tetratricopeptide (TPR) repeat protein